MDNKSLNIRFGVHKDREVLGQLRDSVNNMVIPAHILSYTPNPTVAAINYIDRPYFVDPMTYIYTKSNIESYLVKDKKSHENKFKPSIEKLTDDYNLGLFFKDRSYAPLLPSDFTTAFLGSFAESNFQLQTQKINDQKESAFSRYAELLGKLGEVAIAAKLKETQSPQFITPPYFQISSLTDEWLEVNLKIAHQTEAISNLPVTPIILTNSDLLTEELLDKYEGFNQLLLWVHDIDETESPESILKQVSKLTAYARFISVCDKRGVKIISLYGGYFSAMLTKFGLESFCHGIVYGESKAVAARIGGGAPPSRYYIKKLHRFFSVPEAIQLLQWYPDLIDRSDPRCMKLVNGGVNGLLEFQKKDSLAQLHFIYSRENELNDLRKWSNQDILNDLDEIYKIYNPLPNAITGTSLNYVKIWGTALKTIIQSNELS